MLWFLIKILPKKSISFCVGYFSQLKIPVLSKWTTFVFYKKYGIDLSIAEKSKISQYSNIKGLFTRKLKIGARPVAENAFWVHPADARLFSFENLKEYQIFQVKSRSYNLQSFLALNYLDKKTKEAYEFEAVFKGAKCLDYYLCPTDYHRVHSPVDGKILAYCYVPGAYWPVNALSRSRVDHLFSKNERLIFYIKTKKGLVGLTMVGALCVGKIYNSISASFMKPSLFKKTNTQSVFFVDNVNHVISQGEELGIFHMGSTVICLLEPSIKLDNTFFKEQKTQMGKV